MFESRIDATRAVVSVIAYRDTVAMVDWLCDALGFEKQLVVKGENGEVKHAQLAFGESIIIVVPVGDSAFEKLVVHPDQIGGVETQTCYLIVADVEAHYARAKANGAEIIFGVRVENYGGRGYASRDPEGHIWIFGTYDPWKRRPLVAGSLRPQRTLAQRASVLASVLLSALVVASAGAAVWTYSEMRQPTRERDRNGEMVGAPLPAQETDRLAQERGARDAAERDAKDLVVKLTEARNAKERAERSVVELVERLTQERVARESAAQSGKQARDSLAQEVKARDWQAQAAKEAADQLGRERIARVAAEKSAKNATDELDRLRFAKAAAERMAKEAADRTERERAACSQSERTAQDAVARLAHERSARAAAELSTNELRTQLSSSNIEPQQQIVALRYQIDAERQARQALERASRDSQLLLVQEKQSRDVAERALKQAHQQPPASCWSCPSTTACGPPQ